MTEPQMKTFRREGYKGTPIWQNNPGNLPNKGIDWLGKVPTTQREGNAKYEEFISVEYGLRALMRHIRVLMVDNKFNTLSKFAHNYYPAVSTKRVASYERALAAYFKIDKNKVITTFDKTFYIKMAKIVSAMEIGDRYLSLIPESSFEMAFSLMNVDPNKNNDRVPAPSKPSTPAQPSLPTKPGGGGNNQAGGSNNGNSEGGTPTDQVRPVLPNDPDEDKTNWLLWGGLAVALGAGGYLLYSHYSKKKK